MDDRLPDAGAAEAPRAHADSDHGSTPPPSTDTPQPPPTVTTSTPQTSAPTNGDLTQRVPPPKRCRIIDYTNDEGTIGPAIITQVEHVPTASAPDAHAPDVVRMNLCHFDPVMGPRNYYVQDAAAALRLSPGEPGTWNWPVRD